MARETMHLQGKIYPTHQSPHALITFEFEQPSLQNKKLRFYPVDFKVTGINMNGQIWGRSEDVAFEPQPMVLSLAAKAQSVFEPNTTIGIMSLNPFSLTNDGRNYWNWEVDYSAIELFQSQNYHERDIPFELIVEGSIGVTIQDKGTLFFAVRGSNQFKIPRTTWNDLLKAIGYTGKFSSKIIENFRIVGDQYWDNASESLDIARRHSHSGRTYAALEECLSVIERVTPSPYKEATWKEFLLQRNIGPDSKIEGIAKLFAGIGTYLNKVGHHYSRTERNEVTGELMRPPLDAYEVELLIGMTQLMVTYLGRLKDQYPVQNSKD